MMRVVCHGIDIVDLARVEALLADPEQGFVVGWFTDLEQELAGPPHHHPGFFAGRVAAKEAVSKALGTGFSGGISPKDIEIGRLDTGQPTVTLTGVAAEVAARLGVTHWFLSLSHCATSAVGSAIGTAE